MQNEAVALLRCPICSGSFHQEGKSLLCGKRHCYDIAKQGHVNFAPNAKPSFYKKELFESRAKAFEAGVLRRLPPPSARRWKNMCAPSALLWRTRDAARDTICGASARNGT